MVYFIATIPKHVKDIDKGETLEADMQLDRAKQKARTATPKAGQRIILHNGSKELEF